jgi:hypothetical protein
MNKWTGRFLFSIGIVCLVFGVGQAVYAQQTEENGQLAIQFLERLDPQLEQTQNPEKRFWLLVRLPAIALAAGKTTEAKKYAEQLNTAAKQATKPGSSPFRLGIAVHVSKTVLGLIAVDESDINAAKDYLLASGEVVGDPPGLEGFGPNMLLAKRLVEKNERETVIKYFDLCSKFWKDDRGRLEKWKDIVHNGGTPNFGPNNDYYIEDWRYSNK